MNRRTLLVGGGALVVGAVIGFLMGGGDEVRLAATTGEPSPLILPLSSGSFDKDATGIAFPDPIAARPEASLFPTDAAATAVPEVAAGDRSFAPGSITLPDGGEISLFDLLADPEPATEYRFIDPCAGETPGTTPAPGCEGVAGTILAYTTPGPFRITRVTTAAIPGGDPAFDLCRLHLGTPRPGEANLAIYSTQPGDFTVTGWASWTATAPGSDGTSTSTPTLSRFGPVSMLTSTSQTTAWQAEMGSPRPNPGVVTCLRISGLGPSGSRLHVRVEGASLLGARTSGEFDLTHTGLVGVPPIIVVGQQGLVVRALIPVRPEHTPTMIATGGSSLGGHAGDQTEVDERCARGEADGLRATELTRFPIVMLGIPGLMGWDPAWTEIAVLDVRLPAPGAYVVCGFRKVGGRVTEWEGFSVTTPATPLVRVDIVAVHGSIPLTSPPGESNSSIEFHMPWNLSGGRFLDPVVCATADLRPRRDACSFNRPTVTGGVGVDVSLHVGTQASQASINLPDPGCGDRPWICPIRTDSFRVPFHWEPGASIDIVVRQEAPPFPTSQRGAANPRGWVIQPTGARVSTDIGGVLPLGPPVLTGSSVGPGTGEGPRLAVSLAASTPVRVTLTVEHLSASGCAAPDLGTTHGQYAGGVSVVLDLPVACAGAHYTLRAEIEDSEGRRSVYSDFDSAAIGPGLVGVSSTRTTQARVQGVLGSLPGGRAMHLASASIVIDGRIVWTLAPDAGSATRRCTGGEPFGMTAPVQFQAADTFQLRIEIELVPFTNCTTGTGRGTAVRRVLAATVPASMTFSLDPFGIGGGGTIPTLSAQISRF